MTLVYFLTCPQKLFISTLSPYINKRSMIFLVLSCLVSFRLCSYQNEYHPRSFFISKRRNARRDCPVGSLSYTIFLEGVLEFQKYGMNTFYDDTSTNDTSTNDTSTKDTFTNNTPTYQDVVFVFVSSSYLYFLLLFLVTLYGVKNV